MRMRFPCTILALTIAAIPATAARAASFVQNFDGVAAPFLPSGWNATAQWRTIAVNPDSPPNCAYVEGYDVEGNRTRLGDQTLTSPPIQIRSGAAVLTFRHKYNLNNLCGARVEVSVDGGNVFTEIIKTGAVFTAGSYSNVFTPGGNPFGGNVWNGQSDYITTSIRLPDVNVGQTCHFRWRVADSDSTLNANNSWQVDSITLCDPVCPADITVERDPGTCDKAVEYAPPSSAACDCTCDPPPGSVFPLGTTRVNCTATTGAMCGFNVTVTESTADVKRNCPPAGCGGGMCGAAAAPWMPLTILLLSARRRRNRSRTGPRAHCQSDVRNEHTTATQRRSSRI
jgi:hypothetical protein